MPYIDKDSRDLIAHPEGEHNYLLPIMSQVMTGGELNYLISTICHLYLAKRPVNYESLNRVIGVLTSVQMELYRTVVAPYEDLKRTENGTIGILD